MAFDAKDVAALRKTLRGTVLLPGDAGYDEARSVWNGMIDRRPPIVVRPAGTADVVDAVRFAREAGLPVSVKGGGHSAAGKAVSDDALLIDLHDMKGIFIDPAQRTASVQGGATWGALDRESQLHGLATTGGVVSTTGVGGLTLGGGLGWLMGKHGLSIDNLLAAEVVTGAGEVLTANANENPDLFWALRGGGGNFGVVTTFVFQLHPIGPLVTGGLAAWSMERAADVLRLFRRFTNDVPDELTAICSLVASPLWRGNLATIAAAHCGALEDGARTLEPIKQFGPPLLETMRPMPYTALQRVMGDSLPSGIKVYWKSSFITDLSDGAIDCLVEMGGQLPTRESSIFLEHIHGAVQRVNPTATAFSERQATFNAAIVSAWRQPEDADRCIAWTRETYEKLLPFSTGTVYVNYLGIGDEPERVGAAYGSNLARLAEIKLKFDPHNLFRTNHNIKPA